MTDKTNSTRRDFMKKSAAAGAVAVASPLAISSVAHAQGNDQVKIALVGCGGRGTGAAQQALNAKGANAKLVAVADAFPDNAQKAVERIKRGVPGKVDVPADRIFSGFDAYRKAIDSGVDMVVMATPPGFRPIHFEYAIKQGKHVFMEKPVAVDAPGVRQVLAAAEMAKQKNLKVGVGLQRRHQYKYMETVQKIQDGAIGKLALLRCYWNGGGVWTRTRAATETKLGHKPTEMEYQMNNWYYFNWLCGDHITEQHIHNLDVCNWIMDGYPVTAQGQGGRQVRTSNEHGEIFDHHMIEYTYADGTKMLSCCRHIRNCWSSVSEHVHGHKGTSPVGRGTLDFANGEQWRSTASNNAYQTEHDDLAKAIRNNEEFNEAEYGAKSTMTAIFGRMATYSGKELNWDKAIASKRSIAPASYAWDANPPVMPNEDGSYPIPMPGTTKVI